MKKGKIRSGGLSVALPAAVAAGAWYVSWIVWIYALLRRADLEVSLATFALDPGTLWTAVSMVNATGASSLKGFTPSGAVLWALWAAEAPLIVGLSTFLGAARSDDEPFCEQCGEWAPPEPEVGVFAPAAKESAVRTLEAKDARALEAFGTPAGDHLRLVLNTCPACRTFHTASLEHVALEPRKDGTVANDTTPWVTRLRVDASEATALRDAAGRVKALAPAATEAPVPAES